MKKEIKVTLGYKYRLYPTKDQMNILNHQMFVYNQAYNICLNLHRVGASTLRGETVRATSVA